MGINQEIFDAIESGDLTALEIVLAGRHPDEPRDAIGSTPLLEACCFVNDKVVQYLHSKGADPNLSVDGCTPLENAVLHSQNVAIVRELIARGANVNHDDGCAGTVLITAAANGLTQILRELLNGEADTSLKNEEGECPLSFAVCYGHLDCVKALLAAGADVNSRDKKEGTPLLYAVMQQEQQIDIVNELLSAGADVNARDVPGYTPLGIAADYGHEDIAILLLDQGAKPESCRPDGRDLKQVAIEKGLERLVSYVSQLD